ncbi:hypothetical protein [Bifidobacterium canis]|uniref:Uncharacterized protein n=1 Tax=Bifidobacterium canis TaxID=2610880 RepID=A0A7K1J6C8_9BIFI|nr:hypothetical protein [Bifidobacterium canis]MUH60228.1 hypothetical protein [Bifidobacterium canis]
MKNFFKGLSFSQLLAGALAAVTSFLLSAKIGIAGSVIGVAVASIVSTAASQIYKNVLDESGKRLQDAAQQNGVGPADADSSDSTDAETQSHAEGPNESAETVDGTRVMPSVDVGAESTEETRAPRTVVSGSGGASSAERHTIANHPSNGKAKRPASKHDKRVAIIVALVSGLVAVLITAGVILALTGGKGTDSVVRDVVSPTSTSSQTPDVSSTQQSTPTDGSTSEQENQSTGNSDTSTTNSGNESDKSSNTSTDNSGTGSDLTNSNSGSNTDSGTSSSSNSDSSSQQNSTQDSQNSGSNNSNSQNTDSTTNQKNTDSSGTSQQSQ